MEVEEETVELVPVDVITIQPVIPTALEPVHFKQEVPGNSEFDFAVDNLVDFVLNESHGNFLEEILKEESSESVAESPGSHSDTTTSNSISEDPDSSDPTCPVCGNKATRHCYYGAQVCSSCRAFFRRSVQSDSYKTFQCSSGDGPCKIDSKSWKSCRACRFGKCIKSGMKIAWVMNEGQREVRKQKRQQRKKMIQVWKPKIGGVSLTFSEPERQCMQRIIDTYYEFAVDMSIVHYIGNMGKLYKFLLKLYTCEPIEQEEMQDHMNLGAFVFRKYLISIDDDFQAIDARDRTILLRRNFPTAMEFGMCSFLNSSDYADNLEKTRSILSKKNQSDEVDELCRLIDNIKLAGEPPQVPYDEIYKLMNNSDIPTKALKNRHFELARKIMLWNHDKPDQPGDLMKYFLMCKIFIFWNDGLQLHRPDLVNEQLNKYLTMLQRYLKDKYQTKSNKHFHEGLMLISFAQEGAAIRSSEMITSSN